MIVGKYENSLPIVPSPTHPFEGYNFHTLNPIATRTSRSVQCLGLRYREGGLIPAQTGIFLSSLHLLSHAYRQVLFLRVKQRKAVSLISDVHLVPKLRMRGVISSLSRTSL
jgi:hypothetical protein